MRVYVFWELILSTLPFEHSSVCGDRSSYTPKAERIYLPIDKDHWDVVYVCFANKGGYLEERADILIE